MVMKFELKKRVFMPLQSNENPKFSLYMLVRMMMATAAIALLSVFGNFYLQRLFLVVLLLGIQLIYLLRRRYFSTLMSLLVLG